MTPSSYAISAVYFTIYVLDNKSFEDFMYIQAKKYFQHPTTFG